MRETKGVRMFTKTIQIRLRRKLSTKTEILGLEYQSRIRCIEDYFIGLLPSDCKGEGLLNQRKLDISIF